MRRSVVLLSFFVSGIAAAGPSGRAFVEGAKDVEIAGAIEVPLYRSEATDFLPAVIVRIPAEEEGQPDTVKLALVDMAFGWSRITEATAKELGLKVRESTLPGGSKVKHTVVPELHIGDLVLHDVLVRVDSVAVDFAIGVGTLEEVAVALLPSQGIVKFVPFADAPLLLSQVGTPFPASRVPAEKWWYHGTPQYGSGVGMSVPGTMLGQGGPIQIATGTSTTWFFGDTSSLPAEKPRETSIVGVPYLLGAPLAGGVELPATWIRTGETAPDPEGTIVGRLAYDVLYSADIAVDASTNQISMRLVSEPKAADPEAELLKAARAAFEAAEKAAAEKSAEDAAKNADDAAAETDPAAGDPGKADEYGRHLDFASALWAAEQFDEALPHYAAAVAVAGDNCSPYQAQGEALLAMGRPEEAVVPLQRAGQLWDRWSAQDLAIRERIQKKKKVDEGVFKQVQPGGCHTAWGTLAAAKLALADYAAVESLYRAHVDLDPALPFAYGVSLLSQGNTTEANGPLREAVNLGDRNTGELRLTLGLANPDRLDEQGSKVVAVSADGWLLWALPMLDAVRKLQGEEAALAIADALVAANPSSPQALLLRARELERKGGPSDEVAKLVAEARPLIAAIGYRKPNSGIEPAYLAIAAALEGRPEEAYSVLDDAEKANGIDRMSLVARALAASIAGDTERVGQAVEKLRARDPLAPLWLIDLSGG